MLNCTEGVVITVMPTETSLITAWFAAESAIHGLNKTDAVRALNDACGTTYGLSRLNQIAAAVNTPGGRSHLPRPVRLHLLTRTLPYVLDAEGIDGKLTPAKLRRLAAQLA